MLPAIRPPAAPAVFPPSPRSCGKLKCERSPLGPDMSVDWTKYKTELNAVILQGYHRKMRNKAPLTEATATTVQHEGDKADLVYPDGKTEEIEMQETIVEHQVSRIDLERGDFSTIADAIDSMTTEMANSIEKYILGMVNDVPPELGGQFRSNTPEKAAEELLNKIEGMIVDFDDKGMPSFQMVIHPDNMEILVAVKELPGFADRWEDILRRKHREWRARERRRELVD